MPPILENNYANPPNALPQYAPRDYASSSPGAAFYGASPGGSGNNSASKYRKHGNDSLEGLRALPEVRSIPWQEGKELPPEKSTESPRSQTRGAFLVSTRGQIRNPPCSHCATGVGRFSVCVSLDGWFHGACATCQMGTRGNLCSLRKDAEAEGLVFKVTASKLPEPYIAQSPLANSDRPSSSLKRKRDYPSTIAAAAAQPLMNSYPQTQTTLPPSNPIISYTPTPKNSPHSEASALLNYVYEKQYPPNGKKQHQVLFHRRLSSPRETYAYPTTPPIATPRTAVAGQHRIPKVEPERDGSRSLSPSTQLIQATQSPPYEKSYRNTSMMAAHPESRNVGVGHPATPLIDTLPRKKQKQIYQIIGGVQSGIRSVRQQTESLQKQLDLLQAALGIDTDDGDDEDVEFVF